MTDLTDGMALDHVHAAAACSASKQLHHPVKLHALLVCLLCKASISGSLFINTDSVDTREHYDPDSPETAINLAEQLPASAASIMRSAFCQFFLPCGARPIVVGLKCTLSFGDTWPIFQISVDVIVQGHTKPPKLGPSCVSTIGMSPAHSRLCPRSLRATQRVSTVSKGLLSEEELRNDMLTQPNRTWGA